MRSVHTLQRTRNGPLEALRCVLCSGGTGVLPAGCFRSVVVPKTRNVPTSGDERIGENVVVRAHSKSAWVIRANTETLDESLILDRIVAHDMHGLFPTPAYY